MKDEARIWVPPQKAVTVSRFTPDLVDAVIAYADEYAPKRIPKRELAIKVYLVTSQSNHPWSCSPDERLQLLQLVFTRLKELERMHRLKSPKRRRGQATPVARNATQLDLW